MQPVPLNKVVGSEGRYNDFNRVFLPKKEHLRSRWRSINVAAIEDRNLPPIKVFKIGEVYFVRWESPGFGCPSPGAGGY